MNYVISHAVFPASAPEHEYTCLTYLERPASIWTGGSNGEIFRWSVDPHNDTSNNAAPMSVSSILLTNSGPIRFLHPCTQLSEPTKETAPPVTLPLDCILSISSQGDLSLWKGSTGRCLVSNKLPETSGSPRAVFSLPEHPSRAVIGCSQADVASSHRQLSIFVLSLSTLEVIQTVHSASLEIGPMWTLGLLHEMGERHLAVVDWPRQCTWRWRLTESDVWTSMGSTPADEAVAESALSQRLECHMSTFQEWQLAVGPTGWVARRHSSEGTGSFLETGEMGTTDLAGGTFLEPSLVLVWDTLGCMKAFDIADDSPSLQWTVPGRDGGSNFQVVSCRTHLLRAFLVSTDPLTEPAVELWRFGQPGKKSRPILASSAALGSAWLAGGSFLEVPTLREGEGEPVTASHTFQEASSGRLRVYQVIGYRSGDLGLRNLLEGRAGEVRAKGHTAPVRCLTHVDLPAGEGASPAGGRRGLVSGGDDWTVRVWQLAESEPMGELLLLASVPCHVSAVTAVLAPPPGGPLPWSHCALSFSRDGAPAVLSLDSLSCERILPQNLAQGGAGPRTAQAPQLAWNVEKGVLAHLDSRGTFQEPSLTVWDVQSGSLEEGLLGGPSAALATFCHLAVEQGISARLAPSLAVWAEDSPLPGVSLLHFQLRRLLGTQGLLVPALSLAHPWGADASLDARLATAGAERPALRLGTCLAWSGGQKTLCRDTRFDAAAELAPEEGPLRAMTLVALSEALGVKGTALAYAGSLAGLLPGSLNLDRSLACPLEALALFWSDPDPTIQEASRNVFRATVAARQGFPPFLWRGSPGSLPESPALSPKPGDSMDLSIKVDFVRTADWSGGWEPSEVRDWLGRAELDESLWAQRVGARASDARWARVVALGALAVSCPALVRADVAPGVAPPLVSLVRGGPDAGGATEAGDLLAEGMSATWRPLIEPIVPRLIFDLFTLCHGFGKEVPGILDPSPHEYPNPPPAPTDPSPRGHAHPSRVAHFLEMMAFRLLPQLAVHFLPPFLASCQGQLAHSHWSSSVHTVGLAAMTTAVRGSPRALAPFLHQIVQYLLQSLDPARPQLRQAVMPFALSLLQELSWNFPMFTQHCTAGGHRLAVGDPIKDSAHLAIHLYDLKSPTKARILDASGPLGHPGFLASHASSGKLPTSLGSLGGVSAIAFSPSGDALVAFCHRGMTLRWWTIGSQWWQKLKSGGQSLVQCSKLVLVPSLPGIEPYFGFDSARGSPHHAAGTPEETALLSLDFGFRLEWRQSGRVVLFHNGVELGEF